MGRRITQTIYECSVCRNTPEDGEYLWHMNSEVWCEKCCDDADKQNNQSDEEDEPHAKCKQRNVEHTITRH